MLLVFVTTDNQFYRYQYGLRLQSICNLYRHVQLQMNLCLDHIRLQLVMLNDEYFSDHGNSHHHDRARQYKQEQYHRKSIRDLILLYDSIEDQDDHRHLDELEYDLKNNESSNSIVCFKLT